MDGSPRQCDFSGRFEDKRGLNLIKKGEIKKELIGDFKDKEANNEKLDRQKLKEQSEIKINTAMLWKDKEETAWRRVRGAIKGCGEEE